MKQSLQFPAENTFDVVLSRDRLNGRKPNSYIGCNYRLNFLSAIEFSSCLSSPYFSLTLSIFARVRPPLSLSPSLSLSFSIRAARQSSRPPQAGQSTPAVNWPRKLQRRRALFRETDALLRRSHRLLSTGVRTSFRTKCRFRRGTGHYDSAL